MKSIYVFKGGGVQWFKRLRETIFLDYPVSIEQDRHVNVKSTWQTINIRIQWSVVDPENPVFVGIFTHIGWWSGLHSSNIYVQIRGVLQKFLDFCYGMRKRFVYANKNYSFVKFKFPSAACERKNP